MPYSIEFQLSSLFFIIVLNIVYFRKEKIYTPENKIYTFLLAFTPITIIFDILSIIFIANRSVIPHMLVLFMVKAYAIALSIWVSLWCKYLVTLGFHHCKTKFEILLYKYLQIACFVIDMIFIIVIAVLPIYYTGNGRHIYSYGPAITLTYIFGATNLLFSFLSLLYFYRKISFFRTLPVMSYIIVQGLAGIIQYTNQDILLTSFAGSVTVMIIFFTVENPDISVIRALEKAQIKADEANKAKDTFLANMSHEIRTPLNAILGMNEMIMRESDSDTIREYSGHIDSSGKILLSIVNDILDFSKIEAGKLELTLADYNLAKMLYNIENMLLGKIESKGLNLEIITQPDIPKHLVGDERRLKQILINILNNAFKYTDTGSITLRISANSSIMHSISDDMSITLFEQYKNKSDSPLSYINLHFEVEDTGIGIKEENLSTLFEAFSRIDDAHNHYIEGTGLGLTITNGFLRLMGSSLIVKSEYHKGSVFSFNIIQGVTSTKPLGNYRLDYKNRLSQKAPAAPVWTTQNARVLAVDDVRVNLAVVKSLLKKLKIDVDTALSGQEALDKAAQNKYDIIFMDHMMPEMDGIETFNKLKEYWENNNETPAPVIALTANAVVGVKEMFSEKGFTDYISKPIDSSRLEDLIRKYLPDDKIVVLHK